jgi:hypothetical protein
MKKIANGTSSKFTTGVAVTDRFLPLGSLILVANQQILRLFTARVNDPSGKFATSINTLAVNLQIIGAIVDCFHFNVNLKNKLSLC